MRIRGRGIVPGHAAGKVLVSSAPFSFVGGADPATGTILDETTGVSGEHLAGRIFAFPHGKGSTVGSYVLYGLGKRGLGPSAIVNRSAEAIVVVGTALAGVPLVDRVDIGGFRSEDRIIVDANRGAVELPDVKGVPVVSAVLRNRGRILLVRRSEAVGSFQGRWSAISGYLERGDEPRNRAVREVREETGLRGLTFRTAGVPVLARNESTIYVVHPFLFDTPSQRIRLDWENVEYRWIHPRELAGFDTVPRLKEIVGTLLGPQG